MKKKKKSTLKILRKLSRKSELTETKNDITPRFSVKVVPNKKKQEKKFNPNRDIE